MISAVCEEQERLNDTGESAIIILDIPRSATIDHDFYIAAETIGRMWTGGIGASRVTSSSGKLARWSD